MLVSHHVGREVEAEQSPRNPGRFTDLHAGRHEMVVERRQAPLDTAAQAHPERSTEPPAPHRVPVKAWIN